MNSFFKPKRTKKRCRKAICNECKTIFCCFCGEAYTKEHQKMKCGDYKKWKLRNDSETKLMKEWKDSSSSRVKACPTCTKQIERSEGCRNMV